MDLLEFPHSIRELVMHCLMYKRRSLNPCLMWKTTLLYHWSLNYSPLLKTEHHICLPF